VGVGDWVVVVVLGAATIFGARRALTDGRFRGTHRVRGARGVSTDGVSTGGVSTGGVSTGGVSTGGVSTDPGPTDTGPQAPSGLTPEDLGAELGERATLVQFSSAFCAPCRATRHVLADVAGLVPGVRHVEIDAESHLDLVRRLSVSRTPTTLVLDAAGVEASRASGALRKQQVMTALAEVVEP
jgi:thiol-disulfide isomerase/thioredoxin